MAGNQTFAKAKEQEHNEYYTRLVDIEKELRYYRKHFKGATVLCNCDDPFESHFFEYFVKNFTRLGLRKLIATCYAGSPIVGQQLSLLDVVPEATPGTPYKAVVTSVYDATGDGYIDMHDVKELFINGENELTELEGDGDFRSAECLSLLDEADIVVTNPPFSLFREYVTTLLEHGKKFLIIGPMNGVKYKETFPLIRDGRMWTGYKSMGKDMYFHVPDDFREWLLANKKERSGYVIIDGEVYGRAQAIWFTNLDIKKRHEDMILVKRYDQGSYPSYTNFDGIDVASVQDIPCDWPGYMGVPISFLEQHNPDQFEIVGLGEGKLGQETGIGAIVPEHKAMTTKHAAAGDLYYLLPDGTPKFPYARILIRNLHPEPPKGQQA